MDHLKKWIALMVVMFIVWAVLFAVILARHVYSQTMAAQRVTKVIDGDTVVLNRSGKMVTCRLIGVNTPETHHPRVKDEPYGKEAEEYLRWWLEGKVVRVSYEYPNGSPYQRDRYGRLLVYLWADKGRQLVNVELVRKGFGRFESGYRTQYRTQFKAAEAEARSYRMGLWGLSP